MILDANAVACAEEVIRAFRKPDSSQAGGILFGRAADHGWSLPWLACMVAQAGDGDHVDIGSLFGASAITAALVKKRLNKAGTVYCVDPFEERKNVAWRSEIPEEIKSGNPEALMENAAKMGVELKLVQKRSYPWPEELNTKLFSTAYIDGDHYKEAPYRDFLSLSIRVKHYIGFDNYEEGFPDVQNAFHRALHTGDWVCFFKSGGFAALRRKVHDPDRRIPAYLL